jgi:hypothetical protein
LILISGTTKVVCSTVVTDFEEAMNKEVHRDGGKEWRDLGKRNKGRSGPQVQQNKTTIIHH